MQSTKLSKKHLKVGDIARHLGVKKFLVREWEKEFGVLSGRCKPCKDMNAQDKLDVFVRIKELICKHGKSIADVKQEVLQASSSQVTPAKSTDSTGVDQASGDDHVQATQESVQENVTEDVQECSATETTLEEQPAVDEVETMSDIQATSTDESVSAEPVFEHSDAGEQHSDEDELPHDDSQHSQREEQSKSDRCVVNAAIVDRSPHIEQAESQEFDHEEDDSSFSFDHNTRAQLKNLKEHLLKLRDLLQ